MSLDRGTTNEPEVPAGGEPAAVKAAVVEDVTAAQSAALEDLVAEATDDFLDRDRRGEHPDVEEFARRYPQIAGVLRGLLPALRSAQRGSSAAGSQPRGSAPTGSAPAGSAPAGSAPAGSAPAGSGRADGPIPGQQYGGGSQYGGAQLGQLGEFHLIREVGRGGMGIVYEAEQISLGRRVALKVLPLAAALDPRQLQRFRLEAQAAAHLHHSHIVPIYSVGCERGAYYYAMQFIEGRSLADVIADLEKQQPAWGGRPPRDRISADSPTVSQHASAVRLSDAVPVSAAQTAAPLPPAGAWLAAETLNRPAATSTLQSIQSTAFFRTIAGLGVQAAEALDYAHGMGVIHRDIKPANLMLDGQGQIFIADFGLAQLHGDSRLTRTGDLVGTLRYMSPEQTTARHGVIDHRADIYSLGATLYELLTLAPAFDAPDRGALLRQIADEEPPALRQRNLSIPVDLETIVLKAMAKEPHRRYATARELADDLGRFLEHRPITARRPTVAERASKWVRRHRAIVSTAALLLLLAGALVAREKQVAYAQLSAEFQAKTRALARAEEERVRAEQAFKQAEQERTRAQEAFERTRLALDFFTDTSDKAMADRPELQADRRLLLAAALDYYLDFIEQVGDDPSLRAQFEASQMRVASIMAKIGTREQSRNALEQVRQIQEKMLRSQPRSPIWQNGLTSIYRHLSALRGGRELGYLTNSTVQEHLGLSQDQIERIERLDNERLAFDRFGRHRGQEEPPALSAEQWEAAFDRLTAQEKALDQLLTPAQSRRLDQIMIQADLLRRGPDVLNDGEVADTLGLDGDQQQQIDQLTDRWRAAVEQMREARTPGPPTAADRQASVDLWHAYEDQILGLMNDEQKTRWHELVGPPLEGVALVHRHDGPPSPWGGHGGQGNRHGRWHAQPSGQTVPDTALPDAAAGSADRSNGEESP